MYVSICAYGLRIIVRSQRLLPSRIGVIELLRGITCVTFGLMSIVLSSGDLMFAVSIICGMTYILTGVLMYGAQ
jgi:hypothetical protein